MTCEVYLSTATSPFTFPNGRFVFQSSTCLCLMAFFFLLLFRRRSSSVVSFDVFGCWLSLSSSVSFCIVCSFVCICICKGIGTLPQNIYAELIPAKKKTVAA